ncbi:DUF3341 domain-containing protein [Methylocystis sp. MJC1]|jgi:hypothetical protein|uniref:DUF3341 domain-containing protein n=1 Tax=Methylocystis sp. MJC1 TaxID=2654282 RepID=UPI0013ECE933|nr:DUF3341 domain-containing protein [Methylocystis sp. MJC1]KAF2989873.1 hypothetical protein MJC1_03011 [Methylocystis sp. MJC1]MBU6528359.1 DUF3341 domain-containing protein [Methylocystis sp. MJC1]UZX11264.1 DUF3341 domain-containing protein [Methylocystis sp. MJC1]
MSGDYLVASFASEGAFAIACERLSAEGLGELYPFTPKPIMADRPISSISLFAFVTGMVGVVGGFAMEADANIIAYPLDIGGRPKLSWPSFVPIAFEIGMLLAVIGVIVSFFLFAGVGRLYSPIDDCDLLRRALSDRWVIALRPRSPESSRRARDLCESLGAAEIEEFRHEMESPRSGGAVASQL